MPSEELLAGEEMHTKVLCSSLTSTSQSTGVDVSAFPGGAVIEAVAVGTVAAQAVTFKVQGSFDNAAWYDAGYQIIDATASPARAVAALTLTPGNGTVRHIYVVLDRYRYLSIAPSANTLAGTGAGLTVTAYLTPV